MPEITKPSPAVMKALMIDNLALIGEHVEAIRLGVSIGEYCHKIEVIAENVKCALELYDLKDKTPRNNSPAVEGFRP